MTYMTTVTKLIPPAICEYCGEQAPEFWVILHKAGCPAGEEIEGDEDEDGDEEEVT
jgi:hypothetical protein